MSRRARRLSLFHLSVTEVKCGSCVKLKPTDSRALLSFGPSRRDTLPPRSVSLTWGCRGHVRLSCGWPPADRSSGASSRRQRRIYHRLTWRCRHCCCCSPMAPSISSFCGQEEQCEAEGERINSAGDAERLSKIRTLFEPLFPV